MDLDNTFLYAIQKIPGENPGEKFKYINQFARDAAVNKANLEGFPKPLEPLLNIEIAKILKSTGPIVEALRTSDALLCKRALQIPDLFPDEDSPLLEWDYIYNELISCCSFTTRYKLIKKISQNLHNRDSKYAENFYLQMSKTYGVKEALPLLLSCSENFISDQISKNEINLPKKLIEKLFQKYPNLIISYLFQEISKEDIHSRILHDVNISNYIQFLPNLVENHFDVLIKFVESLPNSVFYTNSLNFNFGKHRTKLFLEKGKKILITNPKKYLPILYLKTVMKKLKLDDFAKMMSKVMPGKLEDFNYNQFSEIQHLSDKKKALIIVEAFKIAYDKDLYKYIELIQPNQLKVLLATLPKEERTKIARLNLEKNNNWNWMSWRAYLPFQEIFEDTKTLIKKQSDDEKKIELTHLLIYNCEINEDKDALLQVLKYVSTWKEKNAWPMLQTILKLTREHHKLTQLKQEHWDLIMDIIQRTTTLPNFDIDCFLIDGIKFKYQHGLDPTDYIELSMKLKISWSEFNLFLDTDLELERTCLKNFLGMIETYYNEVEAESTKTILCNILGSIQKFNQMVEKKNKRKNKTKDKSKDEAKDILLINITDYPKFIKITESAIESSNDTYKCVKNFTRTYNAELFKKWFTNEPVQESPIMPISRKQVHSFKNNYQMLLKEISNDRQYLPDIKYFPGVTKFLKMLCWYKDLPTMYLNEALQQIQENVNLTRSFIFLGSLLSGEKYQEAVDPAIPLQPALYQNDGFVRMMIDNCIIGMRFTNPPISLSLLTRLFSHDFFQDIEPVLFNIACRIPVPDVIKFASMYRMNEHFEIQEMMIGLVSVVAPIEDKLKIYESFLNSETHPHVYGLVTKKVRQFFNDEKSERVWKLMQMCLEKKNIEINHVLRDLTCLKSIPNEYVVTYITKLLKQFDNVKVKNYPGLYEDLVIRVLSKLDQSFAKILPEEFQMQLIKKYIFGSVVKEKPLLQLDFLFDVFLSGDNIEYRVQFLSELFEILDNNPGQVTDETQNTFYPTDKFVSDIVSAFIKSSKNKEVNTLISNVLWKMFESKSTRQQDMQSFLFLSFKGKFKTVLNPQEFATAFAADFNELLKLFKSYNITEIAEIVAKFLFIIYTEGSFETVLVNFIYGLLECEKKSVYICAAALLSYLEGNYEAIKDIIEKLLNVDSQPILRKLVYEKMYCE